MRFGCAVFELHERTDIQTDRQTDVLIAILGNLIGRSHNVVVVIPVVVVVSVVVTGSAVVTDSVVVVTSTTKNTLHNLPTILA